MFDKKNLWRGGAYLSAALVFVGSTAGTALETNRNMVDSFLGTKSYVVQTDTTSGDLYTTFTADYSNTDELVKAHEEAGENLAAEGSVLLKNNGALPLDASVQNVTLLGLRADAKTVYGATVGVSVPAEQNVSLTTALAECGISVNPVANEAYNAVAAGDAYKNANKLSPSFSGVLPGEEPAYTILEPSVDDLSAAASNFAASMKDYGDAAIVVVGRPGSEAADYYPGATGVDAASGAENALGLSDNELALIDFAKENFEKVIVLVNSSNAMELKALQDDDGISAILWIGWPGNYGMRGVADILTGTVNPSGALPDTYATNSASSPAMSNFGVMAWSNAAQYLDTAVNRGDFYLIEAEGIYTGYRYYETRYADTVMGQGNADSTAGTFASTAGWNYDEEVTYPFGYGLSYTTFEEHLDSLNVDLDAHTVTASITVKNTGDVAGKTPVQLYAQAPYILNGVEKSAIQLLDYSKTNLLQPGESQTLTITADLQNLASYDENGKQTYILDAGSYYFTVANGSHEAVNNVLAAQGYETAGDADNVKTWELDRLSTELSISSNGTEVTNQLQNADYNTWADGTVTYLSRADWEATWPKTYSDLALTEEMLPYLQNDFYQITTDDDTSDVTFGGESKDDLTFSDMKGINYDDPMWDDLLNQLDLQEAINFITQGNRNAPAMESVGFVGGQYTENAPNGFNIKLSTYSNPDSPWYVSEDDPNASYMCNDMGSAPLVAATFNKELAEQYGELWGNDSLYNGLSFIWGPGLNLHRHPYNGRNGEYYSEDPVLSGYMGVSVAQGALTKGLICVPKHFAFNDQESNRNGVAPFMQEQKARELELRSFQIATEGGTLGFMTSFSRIGPVYVGACKELMTNILQEEWGFHGYVVSDMVNPASYMTWKESVIAGTTNFDTTEVSDEWASYITADSNTLTGDATMLQAIKDRVHSTLYVYAQSNLMNSINSSSQKIEVNVWWRVAYKAVNYGMIALAVLFVLGYAACVAKEHKKKESAK